MRILDFLVNGQNIEKQGDFSGIVKGTKGYLRSRFTFDSEWNGCKKVAVFEKNQKEYPAPLMGNECEIPEEALTWNHFYVRVVGEKDGKRITTRKVKVEQS